MLTSLHTISPSVAVCLTVLGLVGYLLSERLWSSKRRLPLPPGPRKLPLVGNLFNAPKTRPWETYAAWSKEYGSDILHVEICGTSMIILCSTEAATDLLDKRSSTYSDRSRNTMLTELMGFDFLIGMSKYGDRWRAQRRVFNQTFTAAATMKHRPMQLESAHDLLRRLLTSPDLYIDHFRHFTGRTIMKVVYGIDVQPEKDKHITLAQKAMEYFNAGGVPGKYLVDSLPLLKYVPSWMPGAGFKRFAEEGRVWVDDMARVPLEETKRQMALGTAQSSLAADSLAALHKLGSAAYFDESTIHAAAGTAYAGGADTTVSALSTFVLAMLRNPRAQRRAQTEIDAATAGLALPGFEHEAELPYVTAIVKEVLRWRNVAPVAVPHYITVEDEYRGYRIPANSLVIGNTWGILHDESTYPDPDEFKPERFLREDGQLDPKVPHPDSAFGFGRRLCPGRHAAITSIWILVASILATFNITKACDEDGKEIEPTYEYDSSFIMAPLPFKCMIKPRSKEAVALIRATD